MIVRVLTSCTKSKAAVELPAEELYTGRQHLHVMAGVRAARAAGHRVDVFIVSAGVGLVPGDQHVAPYEQTFTGLSRAKILAAAAKLDIPEAVGELLLYGQADLTLVALGDDYLEAIAIDEALHVGSPTVFVVSGRAAPAVRANVQGDVAVVPVTPDTASEIGAGLIWAKGVIVERILRDLPAERATGPKLQRMAELAVDQLREGNR